MESRTTRLLFLPLLAAAVAFGVLLETAMDPLESQGLAWIGLFGGTVAFAAVCGYLYYRRVRSLDGPDERVRAIELRASRLSHGVVTLGLVGLAVAVSLPWLRSSVWPVVWVLLVASVAVHEASIEYYRRAM